MLSWLLVRMTSLLGGCVTWVVGFAAHEDMTVFHVDKNTRIENLYMAQAQIQSICTPSFRPSRIVSS
jgi:membrane protein YqaA with SNARE-associated domain